MKKVLVSTRLPIEGFSALKEHFEVVMPTDKAIFSKEEAMQLLPGFDAFLPTFQFKVDKDVLDVAKSSVKIIANFGVGYNNIDVKYAAECGIVVTNTPAPVIEPTAEQAFALMLAVARRIAECDRKMRLSDGLKWGVMENLGQSLYGKTLGIVGMGRIGQSLARRALASGMKIVYHNRSRLSTQIEKEYQAEYVDLDSLIQTADFISLHVPLTDETKHLINSERLRKMKPTAILINTARGPVIDEKALAVALQNKWIYGAGLDVFENEPEITPELLRLDNVVLAPHNGTGTIDARIEMSRFASRNIIRFFEGSRDITRVN
ncbi:dihydrofolate reductase [Paludibacter sp. 221]|uniref:2-hydroxyacid dehydrogenase family protein n=1 Tax=Paludibacter sp. 221 TaxID=2302939 RepID=UPI0013D16EE3|nr:2-hydroxyacid dehydrogenase family protein [Paludibacter sp. 221]NDV46175.1 dihydrofolate reductase [Paludibacter sp. 221]